MDIYTVSYNIWAYVNLQNEDMWIIDLESSTVGVDDVPEDFLDMLSKTLKENELKDFYPILEKGDILYITWDEEFPQYIFDFDLRSDLRITINKNFQKMLRAYLEELFNDNGIPNWLKKTGELQESEQLHEKYESKKDVPKSLSNLKLHQANYWAKVYDGVLSSMDKEDKESKSRAAQIAWKQTKKKYDLD